MLCDYGLFSALDGRKHGLEKDCLRRVQCRRADAVRGERASGHPHASGLPPAERALSVGDVLLGEVEAHVKRRHLIHLVRVESGQAYRRGRVGLRGGQLGETVDAAAWLG